MSTLDSQVKLTSGLYGHLREIAVDENLAYLAGVAYGDGYPQHGEIRMATSNQEYKGVLEESVSSVASKFGATVRTYERVSTISANPVWDITLNSTVLRRALFTDRMSADYEAMRSIAFNDDLAPHFQAGLTDTEGTLLPAKVIDAPHGRVFAASNTNKRLLGIARVSLTRGVGIEPSSVKLRLQSRKGRSHTLNGLRIVSTRACYLLEILSGGKRKWLERVGTKLRHPRKAQIARQLLAYYV